MPWQQGSRAFSREQIESALPLLSDSDCTRLLPYWPFWARPEQLPPDGGWTTWLYMGGRGAPRAELLLFR